MKNKYHFIAIGGVGMSGLAKFLLEKGVEVSGSDVSESKYTNMVEKLGAKVYIGHDPQNVPKDAIVVVSSAIRENNPELLEARNLGLQVWHRSDMLAEIAKNEKFFIGYSGTHGKTTTSGLASFVLSKAGLKPSYVVGGIIPELDTNAKYDSENYFCAELDESDGTIIKYSPNVTVINNLEPDHLDFYTNGIESLLERFEQFLSGIKEDAKVLINNDCEVLHRLKNHKVLTFGLNEGADYVAKNIKNQEFDVYHMGQFLVHLKLATFGKHNIYNALSVLASLNESGVDVNMVAPYFEDFTGMGRRFQRVGEFDGIELYDDYAHHPTEIKATLSSLEAFEGKNKIAVFQPHRYTRLKSLWNDFLGAFDSVDKVIVTDVYAASEDPLAGINAEKFANELLTHVPCEYIAGDMMTVAKKLLPELQKNDVVVGLGAGTITALGKNLLKLREETTKIGS